MAITWLKLHNDLLGDIKMRRFTPQEKWAWVAILILANQSSDRGYVSADDEDIADACEFNSPQDWLYYRDKLIAKGMLEHSEKGLKVLNWEARQYIFPSDKPEATKERKRNSRANQKITVKTGKKAVTSGHENVTSESRAVTPRLDTDPYSDPDEIRLDPEEIRQEEIRSDQILEKKENLIGSSPLSISADTVSVPVEEIASGGGKSKGKGKGKSDKVAKPKPQLPLELERFKNLYNDRRPQLWAAMQLVSPDRQKTWKALVETVGGVEEALTALGNALDFCAADSWYSSKTLNFENFATNGKILQLHERQISKVEMAGSGAPGMTASDARMMHTYNQLMEAGRNAGYA
jgi:hypothetical protein